MHHLARSPDDERFVMPRSSMTENRVQDCVGVASDVGQDGDAVASVRNAMRLRGIGALDEAVVYLRDETDLSDPEVAVIYFKLLFEFQDYLTLQGAIRHAIAAVATLDRTTDPEYLTVLMRFAQRCCLPVAEIDSLADVLTRTARGCGGLVLQAWRAMRHRQDFRRQTKELYSGSTTIVSLGLHCLPWHLPLLWGFRTEEQFTATFNPFALAGHRLDGVLRALETDFAGYCAPDAIRVVETANGHNMPMRKDRGGFWNHNRGAYWTRDESAPLREITELKIAAFRQSCRASDAVFLIAKVEDEFPNDPLDFLPRLNAALAPFTGTEQNRIVISNQTAENREARAYAVDATTEFFYCPYPRADYVWHDDDTEDSREGLIYERKYAILLRRALLRFSMLATRDAA